MQLATSNAMQPTVTDSETDKNSRRINLPALLLINNRNHTKQYVAKINGKVYKDV